MKSIASQKAEEARKAINERWEKLGFLDGYSGYVRENLATIFENETKALSEATDAGNSGSFETVVFPIVRRVFSRLLANDIVSVQAMNLPIGKLFFLLPVTSERVESESGSTFSHRGLMGYERNDRHNDGEEVNRYYLPDEVVDGDPSVTKYMKKSLYDLFYNDGLFDQSKGKIHIKTGTIEPVEINCLGIEPITEKYTEAKEALTAKDGSIRNLVIGVKGFDSYRASKLTGPDGNEMDTEAFLASLRVFAKKDIKASAANDPDGNAFIGFKEGEKVLCRVVTQKYGKGIVEYGCPCDAKGVLYLELDLTKPVPVPGKTLDGFIGINPEEIELNELDQAFGVAWSQYDSLELETEIGEVSFKISEVTVSVEERKLRATWSPELSQDVAAFHNIDAEAELTAVLSEQIAAEIDREILRDIRTFAPWKLRWDYNGWRRLGGFSTNYTQKDWNQTFITKVNQASSQIHKATLRGGASFIVVSTEISAMLNDLEYFHVSDANSEATTYAMGIEKVGTINGRYTVYVDPYSPAQSAILGHKGDSLLDTGYIYAPYVPMQLTPTLYNPFNAAPVKYIMTRYAKKVVNNRYYGQIVCNGLQTWDINELR